MNAQTAARTAGPVRQFATDRTGLSREDIRSLFEECAQTMRNERTDSEIFCFCAEESNAWVEYSRWLTERELRSAWRAALAKAGAL